MFRNRERIITLATAVTLICCVVTLWKATGVINKVREDYQSNKKIQSLEENDNLGPRVLSVAQAGHPRDSTDVDVQKKGDKPVEEHSYDQHVLKYEDAKREPKYDTWSTDGAMNFLQRYNKHLNKDSLPITADPANHSTITEWWQAAAMSSWYLHSPLRYKCKKELMWLGNWAVCQDEPYTVAAPCLVYSFGIAYDFTFDDAVAAKLGCDVRSFDPSMTNISDHQRSKNVSFYRYGLSDKNTNSFNPDFDEYVKQTQTWKVRTLKNIVNGLGHEGRTIDILKVDIESTEWYVFDNLMETDMLKYVRHLLVEYHFFPNRPPKMDFVQCFQVHTKLRQLGFREYYLRPHSEFLIWNAYRHQAESFYVNVNFQKGNK